MQNYKRAGTVIFVSHRSPEAAVAQDIEAQGLIWQWAPTIREAVGLLSLAREKTVIVTELALADGNWGDLLERVRCLGIATSFGISWVLACSNSWKRKARREKPFPGLDVVFYCDFCEAFRTADPKIPALVEEFFVEVERARCRITTNSVLYV